MAVYNILFQIKSMYLHFSWKILNHVIEQMLLINDQQGIIRKYAHINGHITIFFLLQVYWP